MLRYNPTYQQRADQFARQNDLYEFASYAGHYHSQHIDGQQLDWLAFHPMLDDNRPRKLGLPQMILMNEHQTIWALDAFDVLEQVRKQDTLSQARRLFREYERKVQQSDFANDQERTDITALVNAAHGTYPIPRTDIYIYLQAAHRLHRRLLVLPYPDGKHLHLIDEQGHTLDSQEYYLQLQ